MYHVLLDCSIFFVHFTSFYVIFDQFTRYTVFYLYIFTILIICRKCLYYNIKTIIVINATKLLYYRKINRIFWVLPYINAASAELYIALRQKVLNNNDVKPGELYDYNYNGVYTNIS